MMTAFSPQRAAVVLVSAIALGAATLGGCAGKAKPSASAVKTEDVQLYRGTELQPNQYQVVDHIWIDSWRSSYTYPTFKTEEEGVQALKAAAADIGAKGIINVICLHPSSPPVKGESLLCYGDAIELQN